MAVNPNIALSVRGLELPDPLTQYGKVQSIRQMQQQNALAKLQMQQMENEFAQRNALNRAYSEAYTPEGIDYNKLRQSAASLGQGSQIPQIEEQRLKFEKDRTAQETANVELGIKKLERNRQIVASLNPQNVEGYIGWLKAQYSDPDIGELYAASGTTFEQAAEVARKAAAEGKLPDLIQSAAMTYRELQDYLKPSIRTMDVGGDVLTFEDRPGQPPRLIESRAKTPLSDEVAAQKRLMNAPVINMPPLEKAEQQARGAMLVKQYEQVRDQANSALQTIPALQSNLGALDRGFQTGAFAGVKAEAANVLSALGMREAEKFATNAQTFLAKAQEQVLNNQLLQKGPQTDSDAKRISQTGAQLGYTRQANRFILKVAEAQAKRSIEQQKFYDGWYRQNNTYDGAGDAWIEGEGGKSLFERPELNEYVNVLGPVMGQPEQDSRLRRLDDIFLR
jgi:hypothetical protein